MGFYPGGASHPIQSSVSRRALRPCAALPEQCAALAKSFTRGGDGLILTFPCQPLCLTERQDCREVPAVRFEVRFSNSLSLNPHL